MFVHSITVFMNMEQRSMRCRVEDDIHMYVNCSLIDMALPVISWLFIPKIPAKKESGRKQMVTMVKSIIVRP